MEIDTLKSSDIKNHLAKLPTVSLELLTKTWIEIILERNNGNRTLSCRHLGISLCKIRTWIMEKGVNAQLPVRGHPPKLETVLRRVKL